MALPKGAPLARGCSHLCLLFLSPVSTQMLHSWPPGQTSSLCLLPAQPWAIPHSQDRPGKVTSDCHAFLPGPGPWTPLLCKTQTLTLVQGCQQPETWSELALFHRVTPALPGAAGSSPKLQRCSFQGLELTPAFALAELTAADFWGALCPH